MLALLQAAAEQVQVAPTAASTASAVLNTLTAALTACSILATAVLSILKMLDKAKIRGLEKERQVLTDVVTAIGKAVDEVKPILTANDAREVTGAIQRHAAANGVLLSLDTLLTEQGLNRQNRDALGRQGEPVPPAGPTPPAGGGGGGC